jgi:hypothetical protein
MNAATGALPPLLYQVSYRRIPPGLESMDVNALCKKGRLWAGFDLSQLHRDKLIGQVRKALENDQNAERLFRELPSLAHDVAAAYARYGGSVDGEVIRLDLMARGLLEIVEEHTPYHTIKKWKSNPIQPLADSWVLISEQVHLGYYYSPYYAQGPEHSFDHYSLHAGIARLVKPAGPAPWSIPPAEGTPSPATITGRTAAEVALDLSRVLAFLSDRGSVKVRKDGLLGTPAIRAMEKAVPLGIPADPRLPEPYSFLYGLLRGIGAVRAPGGEASVDPAMATRQFGRPGPLQAHHWAQCWLSTRDWFDACGTPTMSEREHYAARVCTGRQVLAWMLGCLARTGDHWYELTAFLEMIYTSLRHAQPHFPIRDAAWKPGLSFSPDPHLSGLERQRAWWFAHGGTWYANALMVTLVALGLVERGRLADGPAAPWAFRLTDLGRAVFGAPEVAPPPEPAERRCLVVQPNFDIVAYLDQADARVAGLLARIAESGAAHSGPIQTFRLTQTSVYQAEESGLSHAEIAEFLRQGSRRDVPANVLRSLADWSGKRESLSLRYGLTLLGFPSTADRDAYLKHHAEGTACGERFVLGAAAQSPLPGALVSHHHRHECRRTLELDEEGGIRATQPMDIVQWSRLRRIARPPLSASLGWQITGDSIRQAGAGGMRPWLIHRWLEQHLARPAPPLMTSAIDAWLKAGRSRPLELGEAVLLHVPDPELFQAFATSRRLGPFVLGRPGRGWLMVKKETRKELTALLQRLGFTVTRDLTHDEPSLDGKPAAKRSTAAPRARKAKARRKR